MESIIYTPISKTKHELRLLILLSELHPLDNRIQCELKIVSLEENPHYEALSYVWGPPPNQNLLIWLNGTLITVGLNLLFALRALQSRADRTESKNRRVIWIDALCINQNDIKEKGHQVEMMGEIYRCSTNVLVWLGPTDQEEIEDPLLDTTERKLIYVSEPLFNISRQCYLDDLEDQEDQEDTIHDGFARPMAYQFKQLSSQHDYTDMGDAINSETPYEEGIKLLKNEYWTRLWIIQEFCLAPRLQLLHGTDSLDWQQFKSYLNNHSNLFQTFSSSYSSSSSSSSPSGSENYSRISQLQKIMRANLKYSDEPPTRDWKLSQILEISSKSLCRDPRDKLYGIMGLATDILEGDIKVDYHKSAFEIFCQFVMFTKCKGVGGKQSWLSGNTIGSFQALQKSFLGPFYSEELYLEMEDNRRRCFENVLATSGEEWFDQGVLLRVAHKGRVIGVGESVEELLRPSTVADNSGAQELNGIDLAVLSSKEASSKWQAALQHTWEWDHYSFPSFRRNDRWEAKMESYWQKVLGGSRTAGIFHRKKMREREGQIFKDRLRKREEVNSGLIIFITDTLEIGLAPKGTEKGDILGKIATQDWPPPLYCILNRYGERHRVSGRALLADNIHWSQLNGLPCRGKSVAMSSTEQKKAEREITTYVELPVLQALTCPLRSKHLYNSFST